MTIDVSYVVPAYDAVETLAAAVRSAAAQEGVRVEIVVADDASRDATAALAERLAADDPRVRVVRLPDNGGPSAARNAAMAVATGRWIGVLDADDTLEPRRTRALLDLARQTRADVVADDLLRLGPDGAPFGRALPPGSAPYAMHLDAPGYCIDNVPMAGRFGTGYLKPLVRADFVARHGLRYDPDVRVGEDFLFWLEALLAGGRYVVGSRAGYRYAARAGSLSHRIAPERLAALGAGLARVVERHPAAAREPETARALAAYRAGLADARLFLETVAEAKAGRRGRAATRLVAAPRTWPLVARYGGEAVANRLRRSAQ